MSTNVSQTSPSQSPQDLAEMLQLAVNKLAASVAAQPENGALLAEMVQLCGGALQAGGAGVWVTQSVDRPEMILEFHLASIQLLANGNGGGGGQGIPGVTVAVRRCAREGKPLIVPAFFVEEDGGGTADVPVNPSPFELLYVPIKLHGKVALVMLVAVQPPPVDDTNSIRTYLNFLMRMVGTIEPVLRERHLSLMEKDRGVSGRLVWFADQVHKHIFVDQVAVDIANLVRDVMEAQRVVVELYPRIGKKVLAVSNVDEPNKRANVLRVQRLLFDYVRDRQVPVLLDREAAKQLVSDPVLQDAAAAYFAATEFGAFVAAPIKADDPTSPVTGVVLVEYGDVRIAQGNFAVLADVVRLCVGSVRNAFEVESIPLFKWVHKVWKLWRGPMTNKRGMVMSIVGVVLVAAVVVGVVPFGFSIKADCQVRPAVHVPIVAPVDGRIIDVPVRAGERVYPKGEVRDSASGSPPKPLVVFDATEFVLQRADVTARLDELAVALVEAKTKGNVLGNMAKIRGIEVQMKSLQSQRDMYDYQIDACTVWSPIEGVVLTENVEQKRWSAPRKGEPLVEVASFSDWELLVDVPEGEVAEVRRALEESGEVEVEYILYPWPDRKWPVRAKGVGSLLPSSMQNKSTNVFRLQVKLDVSDLPAGIAMSGVTGRAKVHVGTKTLGSQWMRGAVRLLRMTVMF